MVLAGRWTGSMGEGLAIGMEALNRGIVVGTEMERLAGEMNGFPFSYQNYGYRLSTAKVFHVNGTPREMFIPKEYVTQTTMTKDQCMERAFNILREALK